MLHLEPRHRDADVGRIRVGSLRINEASRFQLDNYPFGGVGRSGVGREGLPYAFEEYTQPKFTGIRLP